MSVGAINVVPEPFLSRSFALLYCVMCNVSCVMQNATVHPSAVKCIHEWGVIHSTVQHISELQSSEEENTKD